MDKHIKTKYAWYQFRPTFLKEILPIVIIWAILMGAVYFVATHRIKAGVVEHKAWIESISSFDVK